MRVVCRNAGYLRRFLTIGREYRVYGEDIQCYLVKNDRGETRFHPKIFFEEVS